MTDNTVRTHIAISNESNQKLKAYAEAQGLTITGAINAILSNSLDDWLLKRKQIGLATELATINNTHVDTTPEPDKEIKHAQLTRSLLFNANAIIDPQNVNRLFHLYNGTDTQKQAYALKLATWLRRMRQRTVFITDMDTPLPKDSNIETNIYTNITQDRDIVAIHVALGKTLNLPDAKNDTNNSRKLSCWRVDNKKNLFKLMEQATDFQAKIFIIDGNDYFETVNKNFNQLDDFAKRKNVKIIFANHNNNTIEAMDHSIKNINCKYA